VRPRPRDRKSIHPGQWGCGQGWGWGVGPQAQTLRPRPCGRRGLAATRGRGFTSHREDGSVETEFAAVCV
jgi:hypothetical protein